ncbi:MAG TPA: hypothetical protein VK797_23400 [Tepidisphaeraceae bacterium]|jgi:hypothetical protein|nr:hypothetical protein [Tepidisphaeraceae bacterium]
MVKTWIMALVCSWSWREGLFDCFTDDEGDDRLTMPGGRQATKRSLHSQKLYPPGGGSTKMIHCSVCRVLAPAYPLYRQDSSEICVNCYHYFLSGTEESHPLNEVIDRSQLKSLFEEGFLQVPRGAKSDFHKPRPGVCWFGDRDYGLRMLAEADRKSNSPRHRKYLANDARVCGGPIDADGVMRDPWLGYMWGVWGGQSGGESACGERACPEPAEGVESVQTGA